MLKFVPILKIPRHQIATLISKTSRSGNPDLISTKSFVLSSPDELNYSLL